MLKIQIVLVFLGFLLNSSFSNAQRYLPDGRVNQGPGYNQGPYENLSRDQRQAVIDLLGPYATLVDLENYVAYGYDSQAVNDIVNFKNVMLYKDAVDKGIKTSAYRVNFKFEIHLGDGSGGGDCSSWSNMLSNVMTQSGINQEAFKVGPNTQSDMDGGIEYSCNFSLNIGRFIGDSKKLDLAIQNLIGKIKQLTEAKAACDTIAAQLNTDEKEAKTCPFYEKPLKVVRNLLSSARRATHKDSDPINPFSHDECGSSTTQARDLAIVDLQGLLNGVQKDIKTIAVAKVKK